MLVLAEISAKKPFYSRHARLTVDGALPSLTSLSRDQDSFLPITLQGSIFTLRHAWGGGGGGGGVCDSESSFKNTPIQISFIPLRPFHENFLKIWASDLVGANYNSNSDCVPLQLE